MAQTPSRGTRASPGEVSLPEEPEEPVRRRRRRRGLVSELRSEVGRSSRQGTELDEEGNAEERPRMRRSGSEAQQRSEEAAVERHRRGREEARRREEAAKLPPGPRPCPRALSPSEKVRAQLRFVVQGGERMLFGRRVEGTSSLFEALDRTSSGVVARADITEGLRRLDVSLSETDLRECLQALEGDASDRISLAEFARWVGEPSPKAAASARATSSAEVEEEAYSSDSEPRNCSASSGTPTPRQPLETSSSDEESGGSRGRAPLPSPGRRAREGSECAEERSMDEAPFEARAPRLRPELAASSDSEEELPAQPSHQPQYAEPSEDSDSGSRRRGRAASSRSDSEASAPVHPPTPLGKAHVNLLAAVPGVWRRLAERKALANEDWAGRRFASLAEGGAEGYIPREALSSEDLDDTLRDCLGDVLPDHEILEPFVSLAFSRADADQDDRLSRSEFASFTWTLKRLVADADLEVEMALISGGGTPVAASLGGPAEAWRDVVGKAREHHRVWADTAFRILDLHSRGVLTVDDIRRPAFEHLLQQLPYRHLADHKTLAPCVGFALWRAGLLAESSRRVPRQEFVAFTWQLARMDLDVDREVERLTETVSVYISSTELSPSS